VDQLAAGEDKGPAGARPVRGPARRHGAAQAARDPDGRGAEEGGGPHESPPHGQREHRAADAEGPRRAHHQHKRQRHRRGQCQAHARPCLAGDPALAGKVHSRITFLTRPEFSLSSL
jgi:hypothetical protein